jgi:hypothetical protein
MSWSFQTPRIERAGSTPTELKGLNVSPEMNTRVLEHRINIQDKKYKNKWESCCLTMDKRAVQYFTQIAIIMGVMSFSIVQLIRLDDCDSQQTYMGLLTMMIGVIMPSPRFNKDDKNERES